MTQQLFNERKDKLKKLAIEEKDDIKADLNTRQSIERLLKLLEMYNYDNRVKMKGILTRTIIDSLRINYSLGEKFIQFDNSIT